MYDTDMEEVIATERYSFIEKIKKDVVKKKPEIEKFLKTQFSDDKKIQYYLKEIFLGFDSLDYKTLSNIYNTFTNSIDLVCPELEGKMIFTVNVEKINKWAD